MAEILTDTENSESTERPTRPSLAQVKVVIDFMQKYPDLAHRKLRYGMSHEKFKKLWIELSNTANSMKGAMKSTKGWIKFWSDKRRSVMLKHKHYNEGKSQDKLTPLERKILNICFTGKTANRHKAVKKEPCNGDNDSGDDIFSKDESDIEIQDTSRLLSTETDERHMNIMEKMVEVMDQQASALTQIAKATVNNSKAMERIAEASHKQAIAVDKLAGTFETINASAYDLRNAIMSIDYTMKRCFSTAVTQHRHSTNLFS
ncbi:uncharacterized protein LOC123670014 [Melitaea cinxia]|uniref:uncharacterized protein LOC123670014 n=1 Tax=Melitaea cinxia TaxID=113334 RepID=UPI001E26EDD3|nr:uncharacterized protein LOC123670014 [Melitaea cinxia]